MKSRVKLDVDYANNPKIVMEVYRTDHVLDKLLNSFIDETEYATSEIGLRGFLINEEYLYPDHLGRCGSIGTDSNLRGTFTFLPLSRKIDKKNESLPIEFSKDYPNPEEEYTMTTTRNWYYEIDKRAEKIKRILQIFNQSTEEIDYIIRAVDGPRMYDDEHPRPQFWDEGEEDPITDTETLFPEIKLTTSYKDYSFSKNDIQLKLNRIEGLLLMFKLSTEDLQDVKNYIQKL